jgi:acyl-CoA thioester hydrolase
VLYTRATTTLVLVDNKTQRPRRLNTLERAAWEPYLGDPIPFSRRP